MVTRTFAWTVAPMPKTVAATMKAKSARMENSYSTRTTNIDALNLVAIATRERFACARRRTYT
jgi:hypothetical protein